MHTARFETVHVSVSVATTRCCSQVSPPDVTSRKWVCRDGLGGGYPMSHGENKTSMLVNTGMGAFIKVILRELYKWSGSW